MYAVYTVYVVCIHVEHVMCILSSRSDWIYNFTNCHDAVLSTNSGAVLGSTSHPLTLLFFLLCMCHEVGEYVHTKQCLKVKPLTVSIQSIPVWNQLE